MRAAGVRQDQAVVVYDERDATAAARGWWLLRYFGHEHVRVLDGGYQAWLAAGLPVSRAEPAREPGDFTARPGHMPVLDAAGASAVAAGLLLDARAGERYRGEQEPVDPVAGHIPGAVSAPTADNVNPDGTFRGGADLAARFAVLGCQPPGCRGGSLLRLRRHRGARDPRLGPGRHPSRALRRLLVRLDHRPGASRRHGRLSARPPGLGSAERPAGKAGHIDV